MVKKGIDLIPDGNVKNNVNKFADQAKKIADSTSSKIGDIQDKANQVINVGQKMGGLMRASVKPLVP